MHSFRSSLPAGLIALCMCLFVSPVRGAVLEIQPPSQEFLSQQWYFDPAFRKSDRFAEIMRLLDAGDLEQAKLQTALYLKTYPQDPAGLEIAALILIQQDDLANAELALREALMLDPRRLSTRSKLGVVLVVRGQLADGERELEEVLSQNPKDALSHHYMGWVKRDQGDLPMAINHLESYFRYRDPPSRELELAHLVLGQLFNTVGQYQSTMNLLSRIDWGRAAKPMAASARILLAAAAIDLSDAAEARSHVSVVQRLLPADEPRRRLIEAQLARLVGETQESRTLLTAVLRDSPEFASSVYYELARTSLAEGNPEAAAADLQSAVKIAQPEDLPLLLRELAAVLTSSGQADQAIDIIRSVNADHEDQPWIRYLLAEVQTFNGDLDGGIASLKDVMARHPSFAPSYYLAGIIQWNTGQRREAEESLEQAVDLDPADVRSWLTLAGVYDAQSRPEDMKRLLERALVSNPGHPAVLYEIATLDYTMGFVAESIARYREILSVDPNHVPAMNNLALNLAEHGGNLQEARQLIDKASELSGENSNIQDTLAWIVFRSGDPQGAVPLLENAIAELTTDGVAHYHIGAVYLELGRVQEAKTHLQQALDLGVPVPIHSEVVALLNRMQ